MSRPLRIEFPDAIYHVTSRGDRREPIFINDEDRQLLLHIAGEALLWADAQMLAYCLMGNHYHFVLQTRRANLSALMRAVNARYSQAFNRRHGLSGHVFQGRFHAILVDRDAYLLAVSRYVELNPVRSLQAAFAHDWRWSSYLAHVGAAPSPAWMNTTSVLSLLLDREITSAQDFKDAATRYASFVSQGAAPGFWETSLRQQIYLGDDGFIRQTLARAPEQRRSAPAIPGIQRVDRLSARGRIAEAPDRESALLRAHREAGLTMTQLARETGLSVPTVSRMIARARLKEERPDPGRCER
jgi:REP element-mobilizing transposase RayT